MAYPQLVIDNWGWKATTDTKKFACLAKSEAETEYGKWLRLAQPLHQKCNDTLCTTIKLGGLPWGYEVYSSYHSIDSTISGLLFLLMAWQDKLNKRIFWHGIGKTESSQEKGWRILRNWNLVENVKFLGNLDKFDWFHMFCEGGFSWSTVPGFDGWSDDGIHMARQAYSTVWSTGKTVVTDFSPLNLLGTSN